MDDITLARKCNISPMNIVNIKKGSHTYSQQLVENLGRGLELNADEMRGFMGGCGVLKNTNSTANGRIPPAIKRHGTTLE